MPGYKRIEEKIGRVISPAESLEIFAMYSFGYSPGDIANKLGRSKKAIADHLKRETPKEEPTIRQVLEEESQTLMALSDLSQIILNRTGRTITEHSLTVQLSKYLKARVKKGRIIMPLMRDN